MNWICLMIGSVCSLFEGGKRFNIKMLPWSHNRLFNSREALGMGQNCAPWIWFLGRIVYIDGWCRFILSVRGVLVAIGCGVPESHFIEETGGGGGGGGLKAGRFQSLQADISKTSEVHVWSPLQLSLVETCSKDHDVMCLLHCAVLGKPLMLTPFAFFYSSLIFLLFFFAAYSWMIWFNCWIGVKITPVQCAQASMHIQINWGLYPADHLILDSLDVKLRVQ